MRKKKLVFICISLCAVIYFYLQYKVVFSEVVHAPAVSDVIIVPGHSLEDGKLPGDWLVARLERTLELYNQGYAGAIIVSGGMGVGDELPVASSMCEWLINNGVTAEDIYTEECAGNTYENFAFSKMITDEKGWESIIIVSNDFHIYRCVYIAGAFYNEISAADAPVSFNHNKLLAYMKEPLSLVKVFVIIAFKGGGLYL